MDATRLRSLAAQAIQHWKEFQPTRYKALKKAGTLNAEALNAAEMTLNEQAELIENGFPPEIAWEMVRERYVFQPEEEGASEEAPASEGYLLNLKLNRIISEL
ncbi:MAG: hypothetical protein VB032_06390 [Burkholderiaceae bacterium]|nr:hypothetical protein [Burkholderiaceae bacterium]